MWNYKRLFIVRETVVNKVRYRLKEPKTKLLDEKTLSDREMIHLLALWVGDGSVKIDQIIADEDEVKELEETGRYIDPEDKNRIYGYTIDWGDYRYFLEDLGPDEDWIPEDEEEVNYSVEEKQRGIFSRLFNRR